MGKPTIRATPILWPSYMQRFIHSEAADLLFDPVEGLAEVQIGQGCGSHTMIVDDAQLSMMTAALSKEICRAVDQPTDEGLIVVGTAEANSPATRWVRSSVPRFETVAIDGSDDWELRIASRVVERIRAKSRNYPTVRQADNDRLVQC